VIQLQSGSTVGESEISGRCLYGARCKSLGVCQIGRFGGEEVRLIPVSLEVVVYFVMIKRPGFFSSLTW